MATSEIAEQASVVTYLGQALKAEPNRWMEAYSKLLKMKGPPLPSAKAAEFKKVNFWQAMKVKMAAGDYNAIDEMCSPNLLDVLRDGNLPNISQFDEGDHTELLAKAVLLPAASALPGIKTKDAECGGGLLISPWLTHIISHMKKMQLPEHVIAPMVHIDIILQHADNYALPAPLDANLVDAVVYMTRPHEQHADAADLTQEIRRWFVTVSTSDKTKDTEWAKLVARLQLPVLNHHTTERVSAQLQQAIKDQDVKLTREYIKTLQRKGVKEDDSHLKSAYEYLGKARQNVDARLEAAFNANNPEKLRQELEANSVNYTPSAFSLWSSVHMGLQRVLDTKAEVPDPVEAMTVALNSPTGSFRSVSDAYSGLKGELAAIATTTLQMVDTPCPDTTKPQDILTGVTTTLHGLRESIEGAFLQICRSISEPPSFVCTVLAKPEDAGNCEIDNDLLIEAASAEKVLNWIGPIRKLVDVGLLCLFTQHIDDPGANLGPSPSHASIFRGASENVKGSEGLVTLVGNIRSMPKQVKEWTAKDAVSFLSDIAKSSAPLLFEQLTVSLRRVVASRAIEVMSKLEGACWDTGAYDGLLDDVELLQADAGFQTKFAKFIDENIPTALGTKDLSDALVSSENSWWTSCASWGNVEALCKQAQDAGWKNAELITLATERIGGVSDRLKFNEEAILKITDLAKSTTGERLAKHIPSAVKMKDAIEAVNAEVIAFNKTVLVLEQLVALKNHADPFNFSSTIQEMVEKSFPKCKKGSTHFRLAVEATLGVVKTQTMPMPGEIAEPEKPLPDAGGDVAESHGASADSTAAAPAAEDPNKEDAAKDNDAGVAKGTASASAGSDYSNESAEAPALVPNALSLLFSASGDSGNSIQQRTTYFGMRFPPPPPPFPIPLSQPRFFK